jgi:hypothetical protein
MAVLGHAMSRKALQNSDIPAAFESRVGRNYANLRAVTVDKRAVQACELSARTESPLSSKAFQSMPLSRHSARSFTFEIKHANRRRPVGKSISPVSSLAEEVFGVTSRPTAQQTGSTEQPLPAPVPNDVRENPLTTSRRVLPDLFSVQVDPVAERMQRLAHERATRRREQSRSMREQVPAQETVAAEQAMTGNATPVSSSARPQEHQTASSAVNPVRPPRPLNRWDERDLRRKAMQAERKGRPAPRLPAGQRWKRRLPPTCW